MEDVPRGVVRLPNVNPEREYRIFARCFAEIWDHGLPRGTELLYAMLQKWRGWIEERFGEVNIGMIRYLRMSRSERLEWTRPDWSLILREDIDDPERHFIEHGFDGLFKDVEEIIDDEDFVRGFVAQCDEITSPTGEGTSEIDLRNIRLPADTPKEPRYPDPWKVYRKAVGELSQHTRHVLGLHAELLIIDQTIQNAEAIMQIKKHCMAQQTKKSEELHQTKDDVTAQRADRNGRSEAERIAIVGKWLIDCRDRTGDFPESVSGKTDFYQLAAEIVADEEGREKIYSESSVLSWLREVGCYVYGNQGETKGYREMMIRCIEHTERHADLISED